jgi:DNA-binding response OmpR family regulator
MTRKSKQGPRILVLEPDEQLVSAIVEALDQAAPDGLIEMTRNLEQAQNAVLGVKPQLFVLDVDATDDLVQDFLYDLRTSHPDARAIVLTSAHLPEHREQLTGLGAIHFLEKPFAQNAFVELVDAALHPATAATGEKFQGTLRDLHVADIIQLKCMSGANSVVEFTGPRGEKARVFFENGQIRHASTPGRRGVEAFNEIVTWKGGTISEVPPPKSTPHTIDADWQMLLLEATGKMDEGVATGNRPQTTEAGRKVAPKILVIDDSVMLLGFVNEVLLDANYDVTTATTGLEGVAAAQSFLPDLVLLDYGLPDIKGDEVCRRLMENPGTSGIRVVYMSGFSTDLQSGRPADPNVIGFLNKPFTSDLLIKTVETHMPKSPEEPSQPSEPQAPAPEEPRPAAAEFPVQQEPAYSESSQVGGAPSQTTEAPWWSETAAASTPEPASTMAATSAATYHYGGHDVTDDSATGGLYFCGDTRFFSLNRALQTIAKQKLTGTLRIFWDREPVELLVQTGEILLATSRDPELYCPEAPITLANVDAERIAAARNEQRSEGRPLFLTLVDENLILREPALQLVQHHGQKLFSQVWCLPEVRFLFDQRTPLPFYAGQVPAEPDVDHWALASLRFIQFGQLGNRTIYEPTSIPAYTRDGFERVQRLRLTVAEAQFASQFNGARSFQQIAKNLRLDLKFARLTLFRFLAMEIVECWPPTPMARPERTGLFHKVTQAIGLGE